MSNDRMPGRRFNELLLRQPGASAIITILLLIVAISALPADMSGFGVAPVSLTVALVLLIAYGVAMIPLFPRLTRQPPRLVVGVLWAFASAPALIALSSAFLGTPTWMPGLGLIATVIGLVLTLRLIRQS